MSATDDSRSSESSHSPSHSPSPSLGGPSDTAFRFYGYGRPKSPPRNVLREKRKVQGEGVHMFEGGKSRKTNNITNAPPLELIEPYKINKRTSRQNSRSHKRGEAVHISSLPFGAEQIPESTSVRQDTPLIGSDIVEETTVAPQTLDTQASSRAPSFSVDKQPAEPHANLEQRMSRQSSFKVLPQSSTEHSSNPSEQQDFVRQEESLKAQRQEAQRQQRHAAEQPLEEQLVEEQLFDSQSHQAPEPPAENEQGRSNTEHIEDSSQEDFPDDVSNSTVRPFKRTSIRTPSGPSRASSTTSSAAQAQTRYRLPTPTDSRIPSPVPQAHASAPGRTDPRTPSPQPPAQASAQLVAVLLQQNERMMTTINALTTQHRELSSALSKGFANIQSRLGSSDARGSQAHRTTSDNDKGALNVDQEDGDDGDDEMDTTLLRRQNRKSQRESADILKDPRLEPAVKYLQRSVRRHLAALCHADNLHDLIRNQPPITDEEMDAYVAGEGTLACTMQHFRMDFERPWKQNALNKEARAVFVKHFLNTHKSGEYREVNIPTKLLTEQIIGRILDRHMPYRRMTYQNCLSPGSDQEENEKRKRKAINARKQTLRRSRLAVIINFKLTKHNMLFSKLRPVHMSADETDGTTRTHPQTFVILNARWQSRAFRSFMRALDVLYRSSWAKPYGERATAGNPPRYRIERPGHWEDGIAPIGLWRNCYDREWLEGLRAYERDALEIIDRDYDFELPGLTDSAGDEEEEL